MQVIGNDMDDLFREAAENYPLKVTGADWNQVQAALMGNSDTPPPGNKKRSNNWRWLLLLLLIPFICNRFSHNDAAGSNTAGQAAIGNAQGSTTAAVQPAATTPALNAGNTAAAGTAVPATTPAAANSNKKTVQPLAGNNAANSAATKNTATAKTSIKHASKSRSRISTNAAGATGTDLAQTAGPEETTEENAEVQPAEKAPILGAPATDTATPTVKVPENVKNEKAAAPTAEKKQNTPPQKPEQKKNFSSARLYVTLLGAKDASNVKAEKADRLGLGVGLSIGYNINRHLAIEAGALFSKKYYNADIKDFNNSKTQWPSNRVITDLQGVCRMIELPVAIRYNFMLQPRSSFFAAAALNSYIMKQENYEYNYTTSTNPMQSEVYKTYRNTGQNWLAILQLSAGWQKSIGKIAALRLQPYYNVPLQGVGIGKVRISGAGLQAGISFVIK